MGSSAARTDNEPGGSDPLVSSEVENPQGLPVCPDFLWSLCRISSPSIQGYENHILCQTVEV